MQLIALICRDLPLLLIKVNVKLAIKSGGTFEMLTILVSTLNLIRSAATESYKLQATRYKL